MPTTDDWARVGRVLQSRYNELRLTKTELETRSGVSRGKINEYFAGGKIGRDDKARDLCRALHLTDDSVDRVLRGEDAVPVDPPVELDVDALLDGFSRVLDRLEALADRWEKRQT